MSINADDFFRIDRLARVLFPLSFTIFNILYWLSYSQSEVVFNWDDHQLLGNNRKNVLCDSNCPQCFQVIRSYLKLTLTMLFNSEIIVNKTSFQATHNDTSDSADHPSKRVKLYCLEFLRNDKIWLMFFHQV